MAQCEHPTKALVGIADGIKCTACGRLFLTFEEIHAMAEAKPKAEPEKKPGTKKGGKKA